MKQQDSINMIKDLLSSSIEGLAKQSKDSNLTGQVHDSILTALTFSRRARESLEGIEMDNKVEGGYE